MWPSTPQNEATAVDMGTYFFVFDFNLILSDSCGWLVLLPFLSRFNFHFNFYGLVSSFHVIVSLSVR